MSSVDFPTNYSIAPTYWDAGSVTAASFYNETLMCRGKSPFNQGNNLRKRKVEPITFDTYGPATEMIKDKILRIETASVGVHSTPILYDNTTNKPIAAFKGVNGSFISANYGDILAYRLDHGSYAKVPEAFKVTALPKSFPERKKLLGGTFVTWVPNSRHATVTELLTGNIEQRQAISILDMRLGNCDRNSGNVLVDEEGNLVPIDHDYTFTKYYRFELHKIIACYSLESFTPQAKQYISDLDIQKDVAIARELEISENEIANFVIRTVFLKLAADADIAVGRLEALIEAMVLPSGRIAEFFENWISHHDLRKILKEFSEPYDEAKLKEAFLPMFEWMLYKTEQVDLTKFSWDYYSYFRGALEITKFALCRLVGK